ncbi:hypothetical protein HJFPF1_09037 [Paramyrothecium foliicola]|nr:hypothetical protein HJFPF1_09037 [Paramyrothecium foliicola]
MSEAYERERQNNARLDELSAKVSALRGVTIDIYDNASAQGVIDNTVGSRNPLSSLPRTTSDIPPSTAERDFLLHVHADQRLRWPSDPHGCVRQQGCDPQTRGHHHRRLPAAVLRHQVDLLGSTTAPSPVDTDGNDSKHGYLETADAEALRCGCTGTASMRLAGQKVTSNGLSLRLQRPQV